MATPSLEVVILLEKHNYIIFYPINSKPKPGASDFSDSYVYKTVDWMRKLINYVNLSLSQVK